MTLSLAAKIVIVLASLCLNSKRATATQTCLEYSSPSFKLVARSKSNPTTVTPIKVIDAYTVPRVGYSILSGCTTCSSSWDSNVLENGGFLPKAGPLSALRTVSFSLVEGESPSFISIQTPPYPLTAYCFTENLVDPVGPRILAGRGDAESWALCANSTANGRSDVVWAPKANHAHYIKERCQEVYLERV